MTSEPRVSPGALAHVERLVAYYHDPSQAPHDNPPAPPTAEIACELAASAAQLLALILEYFKTGQGQDQEPSVETKLAVAEMIDRHWGA